MAKYLDLDCNLQSVLVLDKSGRLKLRDNI